MIETQKQVIATALQHQSCAEILLECDNMFTDGNCNRLFEAMQRMYTDNIKIDLPSVIAYCEHEERPIDSGMIAELAQIMPSYNFKYLHEQLQSTHRKRQVKAIAQDLYHAKDEQTFDKFLSELEAVRDSVKSDVVRPADITTPELSDIFKSTHFVKTGIKAFDDKLVGMFDGQLVVMAGRPGKGKTTLALNILDNLPYDTLFCSGEMNAKQELYAKLLSNKAEVESWRIEFAKYDDTEKARLQVAHDWYKKNLRITVYDGIFSFNKIKSTIRQHGRKARVVVVDYLQIISGGVGQSEHMRIAEITRTLKSMAREIQKPIILLSQLSRDVEKHNREPILSDLRESGAIEADADVVIFLHGDDNWYPIVAKNRKGRTGRIDGVKFEKRYHRICDADVREVGTEYFND